MSNEASTNGKKKDTHLTLSRSIRAKIKTDKEKYCRDMGQEVEYALGVYYRIKKLSGFQALLDEADAKDSERQDSTDLDN